MKLIATTTWNCQRIIAAFLDYHLALGFDRILVMDFDSIDGTRDVLNSDAYKSSIEIVPFPGLADLDSSNLMLAHMQASLDPASICLFCDPDEFLVLGNNRCADNLLKTYGGPLEIERYNMTGLRSVALAGSADLHPFGKMNIRIDRRSRRTELEKMSGVLSSSWIFSDVRPKVMVRISDALAITGGDHSAVMRGPAPLPCSADTYLLHFPVLSFDEFEQRVSSSRLDFVANPTLPPTFGWHSRRWIRHADEGRLWPEYLSSFVSDADLQELLRTGSVSIDHSVTQRLRAAPAPQSRTAMSDVICQSKTNMSLPRPALTEIYIVLGMHRSGTSLCSSILHVLGIDMATDRLVDFGNEHGHWERAEIVAAHDMILNIMERNFWSDTHDFPLPPGWWRMPELVPHIKRLTSLIANEAANGVPFGFKDPRTVKLVPIWLQICARLKLRPKFVICVRNPAHVAQSLQARDGLDYTIGEYRWLDYTVDCFRHVKGHAFHVVHYEDWFSDPVRATESLRGFLAFESLLPVEEAYMAVESLIHPDANHGGSARQGIALLLVRHFYSLLQQFSTAGDASKLVEFCRDFHAFRQLLIPFERKHQKQRALLERHVEHQSRAAADVIAEKDSEIADLKHALSLATAEQASLVERLCASEKILSSIRQGNAESLRALSGLSKELQGSENSLGEAVGRAIEELFSEDWYLEENPDVRAAPSTGIEHYIDFGASEARDPHPRWSKECSDVSSRKF